MVGWYEKFHVFLTYTFSFADVLYWFIESQPTLAIFYIYLAPWTDFLTPGGSKRVMGYLRAYDLTSRLRPGVKRSAEVGKLIFKL